MKVYIVIETAMPLPRSVRVFKSRSEAVEAVKLKARRAARSGERRGKGQRANWVGILPVDLM